MTSEQMDMIYSNDYADFFVEYYGIESNLEKYKNNSVILINYFLAVVHLPVSEMTTDVMSRRGYQAIPLLFGLTSETSLEASGITRIRNIPNFDFRGKGVLIGIADSGIDYTNPVFQNADRTTRIEAIWDQTIISDQKQEGIEYGTEYSREQINAAIKSDDPFHIVPTKDEIGHGTMVGGIAAGNEVPEEGFYGVASDAELLVVKLKPAKMYLKEFFLIPEAAICYQENDFLFALQYLLTYAAKVNKPIVICLSCDTSQYAHDGRDITSSWLSLQASYAGAAIIIPVGNEGNARRHYYGVIKETPGYDVLELNVGVNENGFSMELWGASPNIFSIDILSPSGEYITRLDARFNETREITFIFETTVIYIHYQIVESQSGDQLILLRFSKPAMGIWKFKIYGRGIFPMNYNVWLPMNDFITPDTYFIHSDPYITLLSLSCGNIPITVTAYDTESDTLYSNAGRGYTRIDAVKPDIAAPGVNMTSPGPDHTFIQVTGTCAAAAHTAGVAAMLFEWGIVNGNYPYMSTQDMKIFMIRGARRKAEIQYPNRDWGYGILDVYNVFDSLRKGV
jgi:subtilisin family serine protease